VPGVRALMGGEGADAATRQAASPEGEPAAAETPGTQSAAPAAPATGAVAQGGKR